MRLPRKAASAPAFAAALAFPSVASAHATLAPKEDLPIPEWLFGWGAAIVLIVSFVALSVAWRKPRFEGADPYGPGGILFRLVVNPVTEVLAGALGVLLLGVTIYSGLYGTETANANFSITFVFVTFWVGVPILSVFLGDFYRAFNPWRTIGRVSGGLFRLVSGRSAPAPLEYPERLGRWPAVVGVAAFLWLELCYGVPFPPVVLIDPRTVAIATLIYTAYTLVGMALFGVEKWSERGDAFAVYFNMFSRLAPFEVRDGRLGRRPWFSAAVGWGLVPGSIALVLLAIGGTAFDGATEGLLSGPIDSLYNLINGGADAAGDVFARRFTTSTFMLATVGVVAAIYWGGIKGMGTEGSGGRSERSLARDFAHCFIPIAFAYILAHYFSLVIFQEQAQFTYLLSNPLGEAGTDLFGTASGTVDLNTVNSKQVWYVQVAALVIGHVVALAMGHDKALSIYESLRRATQSQYWMLALMVSFTVLGLALLSAANQ